MKLVKRPIANKAPKNSYHITVRYSHGDADSETSYTHKLNDKTEDEIIKFITQFNELSQAIDDHRSYNSKLPTYIVDSRVKIDDMYLHLEYDHHYSHGDEYYAGMSIEKFIYYDDNGNAFKVEVQD